MCIEMFNPPFFEGRLPREFTTKDGEKIESLGLVSSRGIASKITLYKQTWRDSKDERTPTVNVVVHIIVETRKINF